MRVLLSAVSIFIQA